MKVKTLIKKLQKLPQDSEVILVESMCNVAKCCDVNYHDKDEFGVKVGRKVVLSFR